MLCPLIITFLCSSFRACVSFAQCHAWLCGKALSAPSISFILIKGYPVNIVYLKSLCTEPKVLVTH